MSHRRFVQLLRRAYAELPPGLLDALDNVDVTVEDWPSADEEGLAGEGGALFGLYSGLPLTEREGGGPMLPDRIVVYRLPILKHCETFEEAAREIRVTLWHEIGHYLGMSEEDLHRLGYG